MSQIATYNPFVFVVRKYEFIIVKKADCNRHLLESMMLIIWDRHSILAEIKRRGESLSSLERRFGLPANTLSVALDRPFPKAEIYISKFLKQPRHELFKFHRDGKCKQRTPQQFDSSRFVANDDSQKQHNNFDKENAA